jgi:hypothetical protein
MAFKLADRIKETTTTTGAGNVTLLGAVSQFRAFSAEYSNNDTFYYVIVGQTGAEWEVGLGTYVSATPAIARTTVLESSNAGALVNFSAGTKDVFVNLPSKKANSGNGYAIYLAASLEPDAIEAVQKDTFSYAIGSSVTKLLIASWATQIGTAGRMEQRNPQRFMPLRNCTLTGIISGATAIIINPALVTYNDPWTVYYDRLQQIQELDTKNLPFTAVSQKKPFLPGAYGAIITQVTCMDFAWIALRPLGGTSLGINLWDEISDSSTQRVGDSLAMPIHKKCAGELHSSATGSSPAGSVSYVLLPSDWSLVDDPLTYTSRDDFMGASLDTGVWTRAQSTAGNVEIDTLYQWLKVFGNANWGTNGLYRTSTESRATGKALLVDCYIPQEAAGFGAFMVGWSDAAGQSYSNFAHGVNFASANVINVYENGNARGTVGSGYTMGAIYRIRITLNASGAATYEIQGGPEYPELGGASWTDITPGTTSSATNTLTPGATAFNGSGYISDMRVY